MGTISLLVILLVIAIALYLYWRQRIIRKYRQDAIGHILATFYTSIGTSYNARCPVVNNEIRAPVAAQEVLDKRIGNKNATYWVRQDKTFDIAYPPGKPAWAQTTIPHTIYYEGNPEPQISRDPEKRTEAIGTADFVTNLSNERMTKQMVMYTDEIDDLREAAKNKISAKLVYGLLVVIVLMGLPTAMLVFNILDKVTRLLRYWGL